MVQIVYASQREHRASWLGACHRESEALNAAARQQLAGEGELGLGDGDSGGPVCRLDGDDADDLLGPRL
jgi:hypothetical protein